MVSSKLIARRYARLPMKLAKRKKITNRLFFLGVLNILGLRKVENWSFDFPYLIKREA